ncbi:hypothetical protein BLNAU_5878 [Blattamonas nauphoetae]|uniref:Cyclin N-terminal domain-containing protein n=1 Tax=Blattamonas nauphoetae TaxID=2049346 RepID=A0ABQ9Y5Q6_9EUKA|nr:hypothetical protein BLNAU_5878 [Blattamonas nauphoetae]
MFSSQHFTHVPPTQVCASIHPLPPSFQPLTPINDSPDYLLNGLPNWEDSPLKCPNLSPWLECETHHDIMIIENYQVPSNFFFRHYLDLERESADKTEPMKLLVERTASHLAKYTQSDPNCMQPHILSLCNYFKLDEEVFLTAVIVLTRYLSVVGSILEIKKDSELFYLLILCILIALKGLLDVPVDSGSIARSLKLEPSRIFHNEVQILAALDFSLYFAQTDVNELSTIFPLEGFLCFTYSSQLPLVGLGRYLSQLNSTRPINICRNNVENGESVPFIPSAISTFILENDKRGDIVSFVESVIAPTSPDFQAYNQHTPSQSVDQSMLGQKTAEPSKTHSWSNIPASKLMSVPTFIPRLAIEKQEPIDTHIAFHQFQYTANVPSVLYSYPMVFTPAPICASPQDIYFGRNPPSDYSVAQPDYQPCHYGTCWQDGW